MHFGQFSKTTKIKKTISSPISDKPIKTILSKGVSVDVKIIFFFYKISEKMFTNPSSV